MPYCGKLSFNLPAPAPLSLDCTRRPSPSSLTTGDARDDCVEDGSNTTDYSVEDCCDGVDDGGEAGADCRKDALDLWRTVSQDSIVTELWQHKAMDLS